MYRNILHTKQCHGNNMLCVVIDNVVINVFGTTCLIRNILNDSCLQLTDVLSTL